MLMENLGKNICTIIKIAYMGGTATWMVRREKCSRKQSKKAK